MWINEILWSTKLNSWEVSPYAGLRAGGCDRARPFILTLWGSQESPCEEEGDFKAVSQHPFLSCRCTRKIDMERVWFRGHNIFAANFTSFTSFTLIPCPDPNFWHVSSMRWAATWRTIWVARLPWPLVAPECHSSKRPTTKGKLWVSGGSWGTLFSTIMVVNSG